MEKVHVLNHPLLQHKLYWGEGIPGDRVGDRRIGVL